MTHTGTQRLRAVAVDDEPPALKRIRALLAAEDTIELMATYDDPSEAARAIPALAPDLLFVDIQMPGMSGFDLVRSLGDDVPLVVFVTAYDEHAIRAFTVSALDYLLKPVHPERLHETVVRAARRLAQNSSVELRGQLASVLRSMGSAMPAARVAVKVKDRITLIDPASIDRVEADGNTIHVSVGAERFSFRETLTAFAERLPAGLFVRLNRSTLVNVARVKHVEPWFNGDYVIVLTDGRKVTSGRTYRESLRRILSLP